MIEPKILLFAVVVFFSYAVQTVTGFGSMILCVTIGAHLLPIQDLLTLVVPLSLLQTSYIVLRHRAGIEWRLLLTRVLPLMAIGVGVGQWVLSLAPGDSFRVAFAILVLVLASRELMLLLRRRADVTGRPLHEVVAGGFLLAAGVVHGIYASGGPLLVYVVNRKGLPKYQFRSTITTVWLTLNSVLCAIYWQRGRFSSEMGSDLLVLVPAIPAGILLGEALHKRVDERKFKLSVFGLLVVAAIVLLLR